MVFDGRTDLIVWNEDKNPCVETHKRSDFSVNSKRFCIDRYIINYWSNFVPNVEAVLVLILLQRTSYAEAVVFLRPERNLKNYMKK